VEFDKFRASDWLMAGGGALMLISGLLPWVKAVGPQGLSKMNAFDFTLTGAVPWLVLVGSGVLAFLVAAGVVQPAGMRWPLVFLFANTGSTVLVLIRLLFNPIDGKQTFEEVGGSLTFGIGLYGAVVACVVATTGAVVSYTEHGGDLRDLADLDKMRAMISGGRPDRTDKHPSSR
jgi:H+/Cl- antiporter ClcA